MSEGRDKGTAGTGRLAGPPFCDEHGFLSPEVAAAHVTMVQGGYSTPEAEACRMIADGGIGAERATAWLRDHGLPLDDPEAVR